VYLATGADTGELAADAVRRWWHPMGRVRYSGAEGMLLLADCGGSNGYRVPLYRERLQRIAAALGITRSTRKSSFSWGKTRRLLIDYVGFR